jgi:ParB-like chromosome segregation protein Spo0J
VSAPPATAVPTVSTPTTTRSLGDLRPHGQNRVVPALSRDEFAALKEDIGRRGLLVPLEITAAGVVLDGHARLQALHQLGLEHVEVRVLAPADELEHILRAALHRRQLSASQWAALALKLLPYEELREQARERQQANLRQRPERAILPARGERTRDLVAEIAGTAPRTAQDAITVHEHDPALFERVLQGELKVHVAASKVRRARRDAAIPPPPPLPQGPFELILADPPWSYGSPDSPFAPEQHYPTMSLTELKALALPAAEQCVLFLWAVNALHCEAHELLDAWGFRARRWRRRCAQAERDRAAAQAGG